jgi:flagellar L-ring protein precursor FlgH
MKSSSEYISIYKKTFFRIALLSAVVCFVVPWNTSELQAQQIFLKNSQRSLFSDVKAMNVGDAITINIIEDTRADNSASTDEEKTHDLDVGFNFGADGEGPEIEGGLNSGNRFRGTGRTTRNEQIRSRLSALITAVEPNGNMRIEGKRVTKINGEEQTVVIKGLVRPVDIRADNSILSSQISDLELVMEGEGSVSRAQEPGLFTRLVRFLF